MLQLRKLSSGQRAVAALLAGVAVASCLAQGDQPPPPLGPRGPLGAAYLRPSMKPAGGHIRNGDYACSIESGGHRYPAFRCAVYRAEDGSQVLEKAGGSQRFRGRVISQHRGFAFDGTFFCPSGDCTENVTARFTPVSAAGYLGVMQGRSGPLNVSLQYMPGGFTYGARDAMQMDGAQPQEGVPE